MQTTSFIYFPGKSIGRKSAAFSLVEVVLALGIVAFCITSLLGLMSVGLKQFSESVDKTVESQIIQSLVTEAQLAEWNQGSTNDQFVPRADFVCFDSEGTEVNDANSAVYTALLSSSDLTQLKLTEIGIENDQIPPPNEALSFGIEVRKNGKADTAMKFQTILFNPGKLP